MKVKELIKELQKYDQELDIYVPSKLTEYDYAFAQDATPKFLTLEDINDEKAVLVIDEV